MLGAAVVVLAVVAILQVDAGAPPLTRGSPAPGFELRVLGTPEGMAESRLALSDLRGRVVLVNFWATWCEPCESEMPAMERLYARLPRDGFELVAVAIDDEEDAEEEIVSSGFVLSPGLDGPWAPVPPHGDATVRGRVLDSRGRPLEGASVMRIWVDEHEQPVYWGKWIRFDVIGIEVQAGVVTRYEHIEDAWRLS